MVVGAHGELVGSLPKLRGAGRALAREARGTMLLSYCPGSIVGGTSCGRSWSAGCRGDNCARVDEAVLRPQDAAPTTAPGLTKQSCTRGAIEPRGPLLGARK